MIEYPVTQFQDGYGPLRDEDTQSQSLKINLYGKVGPFPSPITAAASVLIVCRMIWPIFVYQPVGHPGEAAEQLDYGIDVYGPAEEELLEVEPLIRFDIVSGCWIVVLGDQQRAVFDSRRVGFIESGVEALGWLKRKSVSEFKELLSNVRGGSFTTDRSFSYGANCSNLSDLNLHLRATLQHRD